VHALLDVFPLQVMRNVSVLLLHCSESVTELQGLTSEISGIVVTLQVGTVTLRRFK